MKVFICLGIIAIAIISAVSMGASSSKKASCCCSNPLELLPSLMVSVSERLRSIETPAPDINICEAATEIDGANWIKHCTGKIVDYIEMVNRVKNSQTNYLSDPALEGIIKRATATFKNFDEIHNGKPQNGCKTNRFTYVYKVNIMENGEQLRKLYKNKETNAATKEMIEKVAIDMHVNLCKMKAVINSRCAS
ncbi:uncharacterized protein LOC116351134 [Contarinia nasturtii]|uniref:uncharacterized protein LOC116351121 n=1 Tax=Contarinia nasturtii TaxID=265458 RepID=UPI0012D49686|nr:uncharacterized protein LOC116351121 [Contarinia nasturtii]XP_031639053.1 uncharacterized protein LOC116351134 [Contarinia nasturtii]